MQFSEGQTLIHPHHGPATVTEVLDRSVNGRSRRYVEFQVHRTDLHIAVPVEKADEVGLRSVYAAAQVRELLDVLRAPTGEQEEIWSRRFKANGEKLRAGDPLLTAGVVRDLVRRREERGLSSAERDMLKHAREPVLAELALALSLSDGETEELLDSTILGDQQTT
ncbi:CarD family transcriptional regulator [Streptomyces sp. NPDC001812]|jgi:CarD family transcriptional regulator|uniref:CarD family transcriptional regulator n=1 Tax=Streptomyces cathayae TaxID=3031124 RepID=A0ABY8K8E2_9ACTN|nr:CarD family transcriptional regulator [Streptomyces sp. HUAS 5]WGD43131.1 CarD family transcriptional regulator [Streptomyces sp. HUAS 5]